MYHYDSNSATARLVPYYEQHFVVSSASVVDPNQKERIVKYLTRITDRSILLWIQEKTGNLNEQ